MAMGSVSQTVFVLMPFAAEFDDVYAVIKDSVAAIDASMAVIRLDEVRAAGSITDDLVDGIRRASVCLADVTDANPNVMWEVGYATALGKPVVAISQDSSNLPFDIKDVRTLTYDRQSLSRTLRDPLIEALKATLERYVGRRAGLRAEQQRPYARTIAVTGTMDAPRAAVAERLEQLLGPYIAADFHWYVGSFGSTDEEGLAYLLRRGVRTVSVVGYNTYDISERQLRMLEEHPDVPFVDAAREQIPSVPDAPSKRDVFLVARADLLILVWDGQSHGTRALIDWLSAQGKDHVVGFVL
jgi:hypothetical protein